MESIDRLRRGGQCSDKCVTCGVCARRKEAAIGGA